MQLTQQKPTYNDRRSTTSLHSFYIPVMGTGFTIDTPLKTARYGISSVVSLVDDVLIEQLRKHWCMQTGRDYHPIEQSVMDRRALRITAYLNLLQELVDEQFSQLLSQPLGSNSDLDKYCRLLPDSSPAAVLYHDYLQQAAHQQCDPQYLQRLEQQLKAMLVPGQIEVNIMTKLDVPHWQGEQQLPYEYNDAAAALRGFALSQLSSSIVFSAGFNGPLYNYLTQIADFFPQPATSNHNATTSTSASPSLATAKLIQSASGEQTVYLPKRVCLKVSDYRSALIQGKYLAKRGIWVSEFRIESPINCGGHAFINDGSLLGPILEEFTQHRAQLTQELFTLWRAGLQKHRQLDCPLAPPLRVTVQGGVGSHDEHQWLLQHYQVDAVGWGTPFLLVPEATEVDEQTLQKLATATGDQVFLSRSSPLDIPFWTLVNSGSELHRQARIAAGTPGSTCPKGYTRTKLDAQGHPICSASRRYQQQALAKLESFAADLSPELKTQLQQDILAKACICHELGGCVLLKHHLTTTAWPSICPGPNMRYFHQIATLKQMVDHIYGRTDLLQRVTRPNLFINELALHILMLEEDRERLRIGLPVGRNLAELRQVAAKLLDGIAYYQQLADQLPASMQAQGQFSQQLTQAQTHLTKLMAELEITG